MSLPSNLQQLPPQALDVLRSLAGQANGVDVETLQQITGLSERWFGKAIRRLVTRKYVEMPTLGIYVLTARGRQAAEDLRAFDGDAPAVAPAADAPAKASMPAPMRAPAAPDTTPLHRRRLAVVAPRELVIRSASILQIGFDAPADRQSPLRQPGRVILRLSAPECEVMPVERPLEVAVNRAVGPVAFRVVPRHEGVVRMKIEAYQLVTLQELVLVGGLFFDLNVAGFPTPLSAELQVLGAPVELHPGTWH